MPIDAETAALLRYADECFALSDGRFDLTSGVLRRVWNFRAAAPRLPARAALDAARALIGWQDVEWDDRAIRLPRAGMEIDFGGIGKEYAADRVATICREHGIASGLVNLGGDVRAIGAQPDGAPWRVGIRHPRDPGRAIAVLDVVDAAVATSGDYERFVEIDGVRYCHLLDPRTGMPVAHWQSVSVVAPLCRRRRQPRDDRDAVRSARAGVSRRAARALRRRRRRRHAASFAAGRDGLSPPARTSPRLRHCQRGGHRGEHDQEDDDEQAHDHGRLPHGAETGDAGSVPHVMPMS